MTDPISKLRETYGTAPETTTLKGITEYTKLWLAGEASATSSGLLKATAEMNQELDKAILATEQDLAQTGETDESLADPVERCIEAYASLKEILQDVADHVMKEERPEVKECLEELEEACDFLREAKTDLDEWLGAPVPRCPKCGSDEADPCPACGLELMIADPTGGAGVASQSALLPQEYSQFFRLYTDVRNGVKTLSLLIASLPSIEAQVSPLFTLVQAALVKSKESTDLKDTLEALNAIRSGLETIRQTQTTRKMVDLQDGWLQVFRSAIRLQRLRLALMEELGGDAGRAQAAQERAAASQHDSVSLSREER